MTVFEAIMLMLTFGSLLVALLSNKDKKTALWLRDAVYLVGTLLVKPTALKSGYCIGESC
ncbi:putative holin-like toxin [Paenibacillus pabuli]|uniref:putative holin-like toxin n=1 Tax=Paenibacillus pabuli TaxID=1472 RepID=UPI000DB9FC96|nr:putative holin-like toxin [Paenibacillus pabuli]